MHLSHALRRKSYLPTEEKNRNRPPSARSVISMVATQNLAKESTTLSLQDGLAVMHKALLVSMLYPLVLSSPVWLWLPTLTGRHLDQSKGQLATPVAGEGEVAVVTLSGRLALMLAGAVVPGNLTLAVFAVTAVAGKGPSNALGEAGWFVIDL
jgi:hypothetical protein